jgi:IS5 family transposase
MGPETIWVLIPLLALSIPIFKIWTRHSQKIAEIQAQATAEKAAQYAAHNQALEDRVRVLERIVTDKGYDVATQIEALRDARKTEALLESREIGVRS